MTTERSGIPRSRRDAPGLYDAPGGGLEDLEPPTLRARALRIALFTLVPVLLLLLFAGLALYVRILQGPISLHALKQGIEEGLAAEFPEYKTSIDDAMLALNGARIEVRLVNLKIADAADTPLATAPLAAVQISKTSLLTFRFAPQRVFLIEPRLSLVYSEKTGFALSLGNKAAEGEPAVEPPIIAPAPQPAERPNITDVTKTDAKKSAEPAVLPPSFHRINLARALAEATRQARSGKAVSSRLKEIGVRNATLEVLYGGRTTTLSIPQAGVAVDHNTKGTRLNGQVNVVSEKGPWELIFTTEDSDNGDFVRVESSVKNLMPSTLARIAPQLALLEPLDLPVSGTLTANLTSEGDLKSSGLILEFLPGSFKLPSFSAAPLLVDKGEIKLDYDAEAHHLRIAPSQFVFGDSHVTLEGEMTSSTEPGDRVWSFAIKGTEGTIASGEFSVPPVPVEGLEIAGRIIPEAGALELTSAALRVGGTDIKASGQFISSPERSGTRLEAAMTPMTLSTLKALWPRAANPQVRNWVGKNMTKGTVRSASLRIVSGIFNQENGEAGNERLSLAIETQDLEMYPSGEGLPLVAPKAILRLENSALEVSAPEAQIIAGAKQIAIKGTRFTVVDFTGAAPAGELVFKVQSPLSGVIEAINRAKLPQLPIASVPPDLVDGKVEGDFKVSMVLAEGPNPRPKIEGRGRISDIRSAKGGKKIEVQGGTIDIALSDAGANATGDVIVNGALAKLQFQRIFDAPDDIQPPLRVTATLDNSDRTQLGLDINHMIQGELAVEVTVLPPPAPGAQPQIHLRGDLTNAELLLPDVAWRKVPGRPAAIDVDVVPGTGDIALELKNFRIVGDDIAAEGTLTIDSGNEVREFEFPTFSLNVVSRLAVSGKLGSDKIWKITAKGSTFDAKDFFRSLLAFGKPSEQEVKPLRPSNGFDFQGDIDTALGHSDINIRNLKIKLSRRKEQLVGFSAQGQLEDGKVISASMKPEAGRKIFAESNDAGQAFKVIGFYPNVQGGRLKLEVDLDGKGAAEKSGVLWVESFRILGDTVLSDIYASAETSGPEIEKAGGNKRVVREVFDFDRMRVPFSVGHGQFVLDESHLRGPIMGMSIRGKVDYTTERLNLGGTYVPLQGINSALCQIPLVGPIVSGLDCQGVFGITYAIQGPMARPQVIVNPLSMFTPGILRGIMEMTNPNPEVLPRAGKPLAPLEQRVRNSASGADGTPSKLPSVAKPSETVDGWTSETITTTAPEGQQKKKPAQPAAKASTAPSSAAPKAPKPAAQTPTAPAQKPTAAKPQGTTTPKARPAKKQTAPAVVQPLQ